MKELNALRAEMRAVRNAVAETNRKLDALLDALADDADSVKVNPLQTLDGEEGILPPAPSVL